MEEDKTAKAGPESDNIEDVLQQRERLEQVIQEKFKRRVTILFTDICGYTEYTDTRGDIEGRSLLLKHNRIVPPMIEKHGGKVAEIIGDAVMAIFETSLSAIQASAAIHKALEDYNSNTESADQIRVKIGINVGDVLADESGDYQKFTGDVANVAARIQSQAGPYQVLISRAVYEQVRGSEDVLCRFHGKVQVKGKAEPLELYRVVWREEDVVLSTEPRVRRHQEVAGEKVKRPVKVLQIDINREGDQLKISANEQMEGQESTIRNYEKIPVSMESIEARCREVVKTLNNANRKGIVPRDVLVRLKKIGKELYNELFTSNIRSKLKESKAEYLSLNLDDRLVQVPWELLNDGQQFLCQRFNMGRLVKTRQAVMRVKARMLAQPLKMLLVADPTGDLKGAYAEGTHIRDSMEEEEDLINVFLRSKDISTGFMQEKMKNFDLVHFAGHADYHPHDLGESGWRLTNGSLKAREIAKMAGTCTMPALIFSNACQSAHTGEWALRDNFQDEIFGLANAFLLTGVRHYVGTFWEILDEPGNRFALEFYKYLLSGRPTGEAMRLARQDLVREYGEESIVWASYILYGDPTASYVDQTKTAEAEEETEASRLQREVHERTFKKRAVYAAVLLLAVLALWLGYPEIQQRRTAKFEGPVRAYYQQGNFKEALDACEILASKRPNSCLPSLIRGNIYLRQGNLDAAEAAYKRTLQATKGTDAQRAEAFVGLGRIFSLRENPDLALKYYRQATATAPESPLGYLSQALVLEEGGNYEEALGLLSKAQKLEPEDKILAAITRENREKVALVLDQEKRARIDGMVKELLETMESAPGAEPSDGWTSPPLTMWMADFTVKGYSLQEGEERLIFSFINDQIIQHSHVQMVERAILDKMLEELKLGTSQLIDPATALSLGKMLAARLLLTGQVLYSNGQAQVSMRLIEIETGRVTAAVSEAFEGEVSSSIMAGLLSRHLLNKLEELYPLRGKISRVEGQEIKLNIGQTVGVRKGQRFKVKDEDITLEIISLQQDTSLAKITKGEGSLQEGLQVEAIPSGSPESPRGESI